MAAHPTPRAQRRRVSAGWAATLAFDFLATTAAALGLCLVGLLLPRIAEEPGPAAGPSSPAALALFAGALVLLASLALTTGMVSRGPAGRPRAFALRLAAVRLALLTVAAAALVAYGVLTVEGV
ncbi:hypothetical protein ACIPRL_06210 [Streptomyces sp. NPDC090085]|uniref:hypothetical protein n=1 Tax=unclassified Streptomyces TaxID=2593676 RepID=UPI00342199DE